MNDQFDDDDLDIVLPERSGGATLRWALIWAAACFVAVLLVPYLFRTGVPHLAAVPAPGRDHPAQAVARAIYDADGRGHFYLDATVNGAPIRFLVDTGASFVTLTADDAHAAGVNRNTLSFDQRLMTANGPVAAAAVTLREMRLGQIEQTDVPAMVVDTLQPTSLLGVSFLKLLDGYDIRDGKLSVF